MRKFETDASGDYAVWACSEKRSIATPFRVKMDTNPWSTIDPPERFA
jgi:hypothetical protein